MEIDDNEVVDVRAIGKDKNHLKLVTGQLQLQSIFWKNGQLATQIEPGQPINLLGNLQINEWNGNQSPQFIIQDIATNNEQILDYRSKRKQLNIDPNDTKVAFLIHPKKEKLNHNYYYYGDKIDQEHEVVILRDLPNDLDSLKDSLKNLNYSQLYLVLQHQQSIYFDGMPTSNQFKSCFKALMTKKETNLEQEGMLLCQHLNVKPNILKFMLKVFYELGFVTEENGIIKIVDNANKQNIETSRVYQLRQSRMEVEKLLLYDDFTQLKTWIKSQKG